MSTRAQSLASLHLQLEAVVGFAADPRAHAFIASRIGVSLPRSHATALAVISEQGPLRLADLALALGTDASNLSRAVTALVELGYVSRVEDGTDRRARLLQVTAEGVDVGNRLRHEWTSALGARLAEWSDRELGALVAGLTQLTAALRTQDAPVG